MCSPKILLLQGEGIGDVITVFPAIKTLKLNYPMANISVLCLKNGSEVILRNNPFVDKVITFKLSFAPENLFSLAPYLFLDLIPKLRQEKFDCVICLHRNKVRWFLSKFLWPKYYIYQTEYLHRARNALDAVLAAGGTKIYKKNYLCTKNYDEDIEKFNLNNHNTLICVNPYVKAKIRQWNGFPELTERLLEAKYQVVVIGKENNHIKMPGVIDLVNQTTIQEVVNIIKRSDLLVTADSGPMHIAFALTRPTVALFGPIKPEYALPIEDRNNITIIYNPIKCSPCTNTATLGKKCYTHQCMNSISIEQVFQAVEEMLTRNQ